MHSELKERKPRQLKLEEIIDPTGPEQDHYHIFLSQIWSKFYEILARATNADQVYIQDLCSEYGTESL